MIRLEVLHLLWRFTTCVGSKMEHGGDQTALRSGAESRRHPDLRQAFFNAYASLVCCTLWNLWNCTRLFWSPKDISLQIHIFPCVSFSLDGQSSSCWARYSRIALESSYFAVFMFTHEGLPGRDCAAWLASSTSKALRPCWPIALGSTTSSTFWTMNFTYCPKLAVTSRTFRVLSTYIY